MCPFLSLTKDGMIESIAALRVTCRTLDSLKVKCEVVKPASDFALWTEKHGHIVLERSEATTVTNQSTFLRVDCVSWDLKASLVQSLPDIKWVNCQTDSDEIWEEDSDGIGASSSSIFLLLQCAVLFQRDDNDEDACVDTEYRFHSICSSTTCVEIAKWKALAMTPGSVWHLMLSVLREWEHVCVQKRREGQRGMKGWARESRCWSG